MSPTVFSFENILPSWFTVFFFHTKIQYHILLLWQGPSLQFLLLTHLLPVSPSCQSYLSSPEVSPPTSLFSFLKNIFWHINDLTTTQKRQLLSLSCENTENRMPMGQDSNLFTEEVSFLMAHSLLVTRENARKRLALVCERGSAMLEAVSELFQRSFQRESTIPKRCWEVRAAHWWLLVGRAWPSGHIWYSLHRIQTEIWKGLASCYYSLEGRTSFHYWQSVMFLTG